MLACAGHEFFSGLVLKKSEEFKKGSLVLYALLYTALIPASTALPAAAAGLFFSLLFARTFLGGQGACFAHPVPAAFLFLAILLQGQNVFSNQELPTSIIAWMVPALLIPGVFWLAARKVFRPQIPFIYLAAVFTGIFWFGIPISPRDISVWIITGFFIITDAETTPLSLYGHCVFSLTAGFLTVVLYGNGLPLFLACALAILSVNVLTPWFDALTQPFPAREKSKVFPNV